MAGTSLVGGVQVAPMGELTERDCTNLQLELWWLWLGIGVGHLTSQSLHFFYIYVAYTVVLTCLLRLYWVLG